MFNKEVVVRCESGLHNRQATYFVQKANGYHVSGCRDRYYRDPERLRP